MNSHLSGRSKIIFHSSCCNCWVPHAFYVFIAFIASIAIGCLPPNNLPYGLFCLLCLTFSILIARNFNIHPYGWSSTNSTHLRPQIVVTWCIDQNILCVVEWGLWIVLWHSNIHGEWTLHYMYSTPNVIVRSILWGICKHRIC